MNDLTLETLEIAEAQLPAALDGLLFVHTQPMSYSRLGELLGISTEKAEALTVAKKQAMDADPLSGLQVIINELGVQLATKACIAQFIQRLEGQKLVSLSLPALETLSVIAYKQPITKSEIEAIRGVNCDGVVNTLLEKKLVYVSGEKQVIGRPRLYSTTQDFLYYFGLKSLKELPPPAEENPIPAVSSTTQFAEPAERIEVAEHFEAAERTEAPERIETTEQIETPKHTEVAEHFETSERTETAKLIETAEPSEVAELIETTKHVEPSETPLSEEPQIQPPENKEPTT